MSNVNTRTYVASSHNRIGTVNNYYGSNINGTSSPPGQTKDIQIDLNDPVNCFNGRDGELKEISLAFVKNKVLFVCGLAGIGKSQLASKYAWTRSSKYNGNLIWLDGETPKRLRKSIESVFFELFGIDGTTRNFRSVRNAVYKHFETDRVLFIMDNVTNESVLLEFLPAAVHDDINYNILVTSQWKHWTRCKCMQVKPLSEDAALQIFQNLLGDTYHRVTEKNLWKELASLLGYLPLALHVVAAYVLQQEDGLYRNFSLAGYVEDLRSGRYNILDDPLPEYNNKSIYQSIKMSLDRIESNSLAEKLLNVCAYLQSNCIDVSSLIAFVGTDIDAEDKLARAFRIIIGYSLMEQVGDKYHMYQLVQRVILHDQKKRDKIDEYFTSVLNYIITVDQGFIYSTAVLQYADEHVPTIVKYYQKDKPVLLLRLLIRHLCFKALEGIFDVEDPGNIMKGHALLHEAVLTCNMKMVKFIHKYVKDINVMNKSEATTLHVACMCGCKDIVEYLIENGACVNDVDQNKRTPLHYAAADANADCISMLIDKYEANINATDSDGQSPIFCATRNMNTEVLTLLIDKYGVAADAKDSQGRTPLHYAAKYGKSGAVTLLINKYGIHPDIADNSDRTPLHLAVENEPNRYDTLVMEVNETDSLVLEGENVNCDMITLLIETFKANAHARDVNGQTPLHYAVRNVHLKAVKMLLTLYEADVHAQDNKGQTLLHVVAAHSGAVDGNLKEIVKYLKLKGASIDVADENGKKPLQIAMSNSAQVTDLLMCCS